jgi:ubiquinone/menaquinone biosynthesis C-methylase UbiE
MRRTRVGSGPRPGNGNSAALPGTPYRWTVASSRDAVRRHYERVATGYDRRNRVIETRLLAAHRRWLGREASGRTLELGVGTGLNLAHYRDAHVVGVDLSAAMLAQASTKVPISLALADAGDLPFPPEVFDTVTATLVLSAVPDRHQALREAHRVLRPGGKLLALEKTQSSGPAVRLVQQALAPLWRRVQGGDRLGSDLVAALHEASFEPRIDGWFAAGFMARIDALRRH